MIFSFQKSILKSMSPKKGYFWPFLTIFPSFSFFLKQKRIFYATKRFISIIYSIISFKRNKNEVNRTFLALSNNYHASMSPKPNQEPEVCRIWISPVSADMPKLRRNISRERRKILTNGKKRWIRGDQHFYISLTCFFDPRPPLPP